MRKEVINRGLAAAAEQESGRPVIRGDSGELYRQLFHGISGSGNI